MNRILIAPQERSPYSRVLRFVGPGRVVNQPYLEDFLKQFIYYDLDEVRIVKYDEVQRIRTLEIRFGSYRAQSAGAMKVVSEIRNGAPRIVNRMSYGELDCWAQVKVTWGTDPCAT
ncbi:uncharacterized protein F4822DRAFT_414171 [Hypoxylon trugodes]|uniref:uncharacterized protein n=1 Tax=Hypoxylon trugodes TaxID=326681 RepID=UPI00219FEE97|nr:uncharacterized protein F4822DRAFT_414171 [Hypoxylon trugodes]KAI1385794.1 hypothetical protein F4822DRAFT_414171 [Hypoxylon trugodes]